MNLYSNKVLFNLLACGLLLSSADANLLVKNGGALAANGLKNEKNALNWTTFTSKESGFSVELPKSPDHTHQKIDIPKTDLSIEYDTYVSEPNDSAVYVISVWHYPDQIDMSKPEVNLQDGFGGMLSALPGSQVLNMKMTDLQGFKALDFLVKNDEIFFQGKLVLVYNTLYQVFTVYKASEDMSDSYNRFIGSFKLINPEKQKPASKNGARKMNV